jgi:O-methyltransferase involved in polyketide biosynthesis
MEGYMTDKIVVELGNVQKTLFLPLWGRAMETKKARPLLVDKKAVEIMEKVDFDFSSIAANMSPLSQFAWILRSKYVDEIIKNFLQSYPEGSIVNIGCGLDTTFDRVDNGKLRWYDLDLPDVIDLRRKFIPESDRRSYIASSFLETDWLKQIQVSGNVLFVAAGVFYYFREAEMRTFFIRLADDFPGSELVCDVSSPYGVKVANKMVIKRGGLDEKSNLTWGLGKAEDLTTWDRRINILQKHYYFRGNRKLLPFKIWLIGSFSDSQNIQYMVHLKFAEKE